MSLVPGYRESRTRFVLTKCPKIIGSCSSVVMLPRLAIPRGPFALRRPLAHHENFGNSASRKIGA